MLITTADPIPTRKSKTQIPLTYRFGIFNQFISVTLVPGELPLVTKDGITLSPALFQNAYYKSLTLQKQALADHIVLWDTPAALAVWAYQFFEDGVHQLTWRLLEEGILMASIDVNSNQIRPFQALRLPKFGDWQRPIYIGDFAGYRDAPMVSLITKIRGSEYHFVPHLL